MAEPTITEQVVREAPDIEAIKIALLRDAQELSSTPVDLPDYQVAGFTDLQRVAQGRGEAGIGGFEPYLAAGSQLMGQAAAPVQGAYQAANPYITGGIDSGQAMVGQGVGSGQALMGQGIGSGQAMIGQGIGSGQAMIGQGVGSGQAMMGQGAQGFTAEQLAGYMNPYQQAVSDEINRSYDISLNNTAGQAVGQGAFGGSRGEVALQEINRNRGTALAQAQAANFAQASQQASAERQRQIVAGQGIGSLGVQGGQASGQLGVQGGQASGQLGVQGGQVLGQLGIAQGEALSNLGIRQAALGETQQKLNQADTQFGFDLGERDRMLNQMTLDAGRRSQIEEAYEPYQRVGFLSDIYKGAPTTQMSLTGASTPTASPFQQLVGGLTAVGSTAAAANKAGLFG